MVHCHILLPIVKGQISLSKIWSNLYNFVVTSHPFMGLLVASVFRRRLTVPMGFKAKVDAQSHVLLHINFKILIQSSMNVANDCWSIPALLCFRLTWLLGKSSSYRLYSKKWMILWARLLACHLDFQFHPDTDDLNEVHPEECDLPLLYLGLPKLFSGYPLNPLN